MDRLPGDRERREAVAARAAALEREKAAAIAQARRLLAGFVQEMARRGIPPHRLRARVPESRTTYRTSLTGWYLRRNRSLAVDVRGELYFLEVAPRLASRLFGVRVRPVDPPLRVGVGARDGESTLLAELLRLRLAAEAGMR